MMTLEEIKLHINEYIENVFIIAQQSCINSFSKNIQLIERFVFVEEHKNNLNYSKFNKIECLNKREFISKEKLATDIFDNQNNLSWIDFVLFYSSENETIIIVELIEYKNSKDLNFHCCIMIPLSFVEDKNKKFDINWVVNSKN